MADEPRLVELSATAPKQVPELPIKPGHLTTLLFGAPLKLAGVELEEREGFSRVTVVEDMLTVLPSSTLVVGRRLRLRVRFEGTVPTSADFLLVVSAAKAERQVNVNLQPEAPHACWREAEEERIKVRRCEAEREQAHKTPDGLTGLLVNEQVDETGLAVRRLHLRRNFTQRPGEPLSVWAATSYRARGVVAVVLTVDNLSARPWTAAGSALVGKGGLRLKVLRVWPLEPLLPGAQGQRVVVEAEVTGAQTRGPFTLSLWQEGEPPSVSLEGVTFP
jgi:uncharacterized protein (TIGR02268 family)